MDPWVNHHRRRRDHHHHPSFSSTLLDQICNSIDDPSHVVSMRKNQTIAEKILVNRRKTADDSVRSKNLKKTVEPVFFKHSSSSSSSDSSGFSSFSSDSFYRRTRSPPPEIHHPKPIRTTVERSPQVHGSFRRTKSKALKMYSDLKKAKQPISPGGRLATFINSIFTGNMKKLNKTNNITATSSTTCSSASSFSRSCLSKTPSSSEKSKRSVRFCPVNVILNEDSKRSHHQNFDTIEIRVMEENRRVIEAAKELFRTYEKNKDVVKISDEDEEEEDDDAASCASTDLFELDNLSAIGIDRYHEELPVYETTRFNTNRR